MGKKQSVHKQEFYSLQQEIACPVQQFLSKLNAKAEHLNFNLKCCSCHQPNSYAQEMVPDQLTVGLADRGIKGEVLAKASQLTSRQNSILFKPWRRERSK